MNNSRVRIRVLHMVRNLNDGGMERLVAQIAKTTDTTEFETHVLCFEFVGRFGEELEGVPLHLVSPLPRYSMLWPGPLIRQIKALNPDVVHTHSGVWYKASLAARLAGVKRVIHTDHGRLDPDPLINRLLDRVAARRTDVVVAVSDALAHVLIERRIARRRQVAVVRNGVDTSAIYPAHRGAALKRLLGLPPEALVIGSVGRLQPIKAYHLMINALAVLRARSPDVPLPVLVLAGDGPERSALRRQAASLRLSESVRLVGWCSNINDLYSTFDVFSLSSHSEGTSLSLLEAMSAGVCPVVTDVGGNRAVLGRELVHRLVPPNSAESLAEGWRDALLHPDRRRCDAVLARKRVEAKFSLTTTVREYERLYCGHVERTSADRTV